MTETLRAAFVIGRRDFTAILFSKAFLFFLLGPLFPLAVGLAAGGISSQVADDIDNDAVGLLLPTDQAAALIATRGELAQALGERRYPEMRALSGGSGRPADYLKKTEGGNGAEPELAAVLSGSFDAPVLTATAGQAEQIKGELSLIISMAKKGTAQELTPVRVDTVETSAGDAQTAQLITGQIAQALLFLLTMLLAGMVLSNLVEEKSNKIIEILAAAIPIDSVFLGKLFAMLAMAVVGIAVWASVGLIALEIWGPGLPNLPPPAIGWPIFAILTVIYFAMAYLILGSLFLGIGAMASTVREVQTLSMPVTMLQLLVFFFAMYTVTKLDEPIEQIACIFPFTSPFAMIARAAQAPEIWPHFVGIAGQALFALLILRISVILFRRNVMKSGGGGKTGRGGLLAVFRGRRTVG